VWAGMGLVAAGLVIGLAAGTRRTPDSRGRSRGLAGTNVPTRADERADSRG
jgi:hypothetical protein